MMSIINTCVIESYETIQLNLSANYQRTFNCDLTDDPRCTIKRYFG